MQWVGVTASAACAPCAAVFAETRLGDPAGDVAGGLHEGDDAETERRELHVMMMLRQNAVATALYATYMYDYTDIVRRDT